MSAERGEGASRTKRGRKTAPPPDPDVTCLICKQPVVSALGLPYSCVTGGLQSVISASEQRGDGLDSILRECVSVWLHRKCRCDYINAKYIAQGTQGAAKSEPYQPPLRSRATNFVFNRDCLFCGDSASKLARKGRIVHEVQTNEFETTTRKCISKWTLIHEWGCVVKTRLDQRLERDNLPAGEARYHKDCYVRFLSDNLFATSQCDTLNDSDQYHFSLQKLEAILESLKPYNQFEDCLFCGDTATMPTKGPMQEVQSTELDQIVKCIVKRRLANEWSCEVKLRLDQRIEADLPAAEARYHGVCFQRFLLGKPKTVTKSSGGRPIGLADTNKETSFRALVNYLNSSDECQYSFQQLEDILKGFGGETYSRKWLKIKLSKEYGNGVFFSGGSECIVNFTGFAEKLLYDNWYKERNTAEGEERTRIVDLATHIILEDVRKKVCNMDMYPTTEDMKSSPLPDSLNCLLSGLITTRSKSTEIVERKRNAIGQAIMYACRPRSYIPPLLLGLTADCHQHVASRELIDMLHSFGFFVSYPEAKRFVYNMTVSACEAQEQASEEPEAGEVPAGTASPLPGYVQFVFDNADWNTNTLDGRGTFHCLGGIRISTPAPGTPSAPVPRRPLPSSAEQILEKGRFAIQLMWYVKPPVNGISKIKVRKVTSSALSSCPDPMIIKAMTIDTLWLAGRWGQVPQAPSWSGYMKSAMSAVGTFSFSTSGIEALPFIDMAATNLTTLYSALCFVVRESTKRGSKWCFVTFDQPLFSKAMEIVASDTSGELDCIKVRLGGFHLLMSFMGCIMYFMRGSGLVELLAEVYADNSAKNMMIGKEYARCLRALFLVQEAIGGRLLDTITMTHGDKEAILKLHQDFLDGKASPDDVVMNEAVQRMRTSLALAGEAAARRSRTGALWWQLYKLVGLLRLFIRAERTADWALHLECITAMLPFFHAAGHVHYARAAHLYVQQMQELPVDAAEAAREGLFTVRRAPLRWSGVWTDMVIEQDLMRPLKIQGGLTRGRGLTDSVISQWVASMPAMLRVSDAVEKMSGVRRESSEQHVELRTTRQLRDQRDLGKFADWLRDHSPFEDSDGIRCIATGVVGARNVNCDRAEEVGQDLLARAVGMTFSSLKIQRKNRVVPLSLAAPKPKPEDPDEIDFNLVFLRMLMLGVKREKVKEYLKREMCKKPPALFDKKGLMRRTNKASITRKLHSQSEGLDGDLGDLFDEMGLAELGLRPSTRSRVAVQEANAAASTNVVDGGYLLHVVKWDGLKTYGTLCAAYATHNKNLAGNVVVFDGYEVRWSTKAEEQERRAGRQRPCPDIDIGKNTAVTVAREDFLANKTNKTSLIRMLSSVLRNNNVEVKQADADADVLIAETALDVHAATHQPVSVVARDTDILMILIARATNDSAITVKQPGGTEYDIGAQRIALGELVSLLIVVYAITGCDTCSALHGKGKQRLWEKVMKSKELQDACREFLKPNADRDKIAECGEMLILALYVKNCISSSCYSLNDARYFEFCERVTRKDKNLKLEDFPPTSDAARQHSFRSYLQIQQWFGNNLNPLDWGWRNNGNTLEPVPMTLPPVPEELMALVSCSCKAGCKEGSNCSCRTSGLGLPCSPACRNCRGETCHNTAEGNEEDWGDI